MFGDDKLQLSLRFLPLLDLFFELVQEPPFLDRRVLVHIVGHIGGKMSLFVILSNVVDHLHVLVILALQNLFAWEFAA